ncbi:hypothetical protein QBC39DRAFT_366548 [Podospora conica]|nr:hypothetical protein QBC39DRAFT_366548 [Schizothecium conicum]
MPRVNQHNTPLLRSSSNAAGVGIYIKHETVIIMSDNTSPVVSPPGERRSSQVNGGSSHFITVVSGPPIANNNNTTTTTTATTGDSQVHHLCRPKVFRKLSNSSSILSEIFRHPDTSEDLLRKKIKRANDRDTSFGLLDFLRNKTPPPENYMSDPNQLKGGEPPAKKKKGVVLSLLRLGSKFRRGKKAGQPTSSTPSPAPPLLRLPDSAVAGRTIDGHRHIAISIPVEHAHVDGIVDEPRPAAEPSPADQPPPKDAAKQGPITIRRKPLSSKTRAAPVVGGRSSSVGAAAAAIRVIPASSERTPHPMQLDPEETIDAPPTSPPEDGAAATQHGGNDKDGGTGGLPAAVVPGVVVPLNGVRPPPRQLHRSPPPLPPRHLNHSSPLHRPHEELNPRNEDSVSKVESYASSVGTTVGVSVIPEIKGLQNTVSESKYIPEKKLYREWCCIGQLPTPPCEREEILSEAEAEENDRFVTAQPSFDNTPWATPFEEGTFVDFPPCGSSTPKLRPLPSPSLPDPSSIYSDSNTNNKIPEPQTKNKRRIPRSESHMKLMEKYQRLQMLRARELEILLGRVKELEEAGGHQGEVGARRGRVNVHALEPEHYTTVAAKPSSKGVAVLYEHDDSHDEAERDSCGDYKDLSSVAFRETLSDDDEASTTLPENLESDYEESSASSAFRSNPYSHDDNKERPSTSCLPSLDAASNTTTIDHHHSTADTPRNDVDLLPSRRRRGFPHPPTVFPPVNTMYSAPLPKTGRGPNDSFESFLERMDESVKRHKARETPRRSYEENYKRRGGHYLLGDFDGARGDGLDTVEPVMRWLIETSGHAGRGGDEEECEMF